MAIVVPKKIYINYVNRDEGEDVVKLGFATYADKEDKAFLKRKDTIDHWAKPSTKWNGTEYVPQPKPYSAEYIDNQPRSGFKIPRHVRRWGWNGGNVLWRVEDPRGFELEIPSENMGQLMMHGTIENGEIKQECVWGWNKTGGSKCVLLPVNSQPYKEAVHDTLLHNSKVSMKEVSIGDRITLKNGAEGIFYGIHHFLQMQHVSTQYGYYHYPNYFDRNYYASLTYDEFVNTALTEIPFVPDEKEILRYGYSGKKISVVKRYFLKLDDGNWYIQNSPRVALLEKSNQPPLTKQQAYEEIVESIDSGKKLTEEHDSTVRWGYCSVDMIGMVPNKNTRGEFKLIPTTLAEIEKGLDDRRYSIPVVFDYRGTSHLAYVGAADFDNGTIADQQLLRKEFLEQGMVISKSHNRDRGHERISISRTDAQLTLSDETKYYILAYDLDGKLTY